MNERGATAESALPVASMERIELMDVLRGVALFGVFLMNLTGFAQAGIMATEQQLLSLPSAPLDHALANVLDWLVLDKANTLFAFLFGLGFYLQMQRLEARGVDFVPLYRRRLAVLLIIGLAHFFFLWTWDILHLYALAGFVLLAFRSLSNRDLVAVGIICAVLGRIGEKAIVEFGVVSTGTGAADPYAEAAVLERQQLAQAGDYFPIVRNFFDWAMVDYLLSGMILGWMFYALGRFFIGAWVGRQGWIARAQQYLPGWRRVLRVGLPAGLLLEGVAVLLSESPLLPEHAHREFFAQVLHLAAVPVLATGYVAAVVVSFQTKLGRRLLAPFAASGRMALTNYIGQSFVMGYVLFGVGPGLALAGRIGTTALTGIVVVAYAVQMLASRLWMAHFRYGPLEWLWRALTYGNLVSMRLRLRPE